MKRRDCCLSATDAQLEKERFMRKSAESRAARAEAEWKHLLDGVGRSETIYIAGTKYAPVAEPAVSYTDAEARGMRRALKRLERLEGKR